MNKLPFHGFAFRHLVCLLMCASGLTVLVTPAFAQMALISETRSVTASYYGGGIETHVSSGTFGLFEATAIGTPFGGGFVRMSQISNITSSDVTIEHRGTDAFGPGGYGRSDLSFRFGLMEDTRITISGYCTFFSGFVSLTSDSFGAIPVAWSGNFLNFDQVLSAGTYVLSSYELPRESVTTRISLHAFSVPDCGVTGVLFAVGLIGLFAAKHCILATRHS